MTVTQALETASIASFSYSLDELAKRPPLVIVGGRVTLANLFGSRQRPGRVSRAHNGILCLDDASLMPYQVVESLRSSMQHANVVISVGPRTVIWPANYQLVVGMNASSWSDAQGMGAKARDTWTGRVSPVQDMIAIRTGLAPKQATPPVCEESANAVAQRVGEAWERQAARLAPFGAVRNDQASSAMLRLELPRPAGFQRLEELYSKGELSVRGVESVLKVAWTLADLEGKDKPNHSHLHEALQLRNSDRGPIRGADASTANADRLRRDPTLPLIRQNGRAGADPESAHPPPSPA